MLTEDEAKAVQEVAKATQETAKVAGKAVDASTGFAQFVGSIIRAPLEQASGLIADRLFYAREERKLRFMARYRELAQQLGVQGPMRPVPLNVAIPLLHAATIEENDALQDIWAQMLLNATNVDRGSEVRRKFVSILENLGALEVPDT